MATKLGKIKKISDLRSVWAHEANDFTKWLAEEENLAELSDSIGIDIELEERESSVGSFNVDLYATESGTGRKIIIENQLEDTNHDHLGKLITYASGKGADVIIWIVKRARDEHRQAIEWLNQHTDANIGFFLVEIELWQIDNSEPAPKFNVVEKPNDWAKTMKSVDGMNEGQKLRLEFWQYFNNVMSDNPDFTNNFTTRQATGRHAYDLTLGTSAYHIVMRVANQKDRRIETGVYINNNKEIFAVFQSHLEDFERALEGNVVFESDESKKSSRFYIRKDLNIHDRKTWEEGANWLLEKDLIIKQLCQKYDRPSSVRPRPIK